MPADASAAATPAAAGATPAARSSAPNEWVQVTAMPDGPPPALSREVTAQRKELASTGWGCLKLSVWHERDSNLLKLRVFEVGAAVL